MSSAHSDATCEPTVEGPHLANIYCYSANTVITNILVGNDPAGLAITPDGTRVYVTNQVDHTVSVIDTATHTVIATIPVGSDTDGGFPQDRSRHSRRYPRLHGKCYRLLEVRSEFFNVRSGTV